MILNICTVIDHALVLSNKSTGLVEERFLSPAYWWWNLWRLGIFIPIGWLIPDHRYYWPIPADGLSITDNNGRLQGAIRVKSNKKAKKRLKNWKAIDQSWIEASFMIYNWYNESKIPRQYSYKGVITIDKTSHYLLWQVHHQGFHGSFSS